MLLVSFPIPVDFSSISGGFLNRFSYIPQPISGYFLPIHEFYQLHFNFSPISSHLSYVFFKAIFPINCSAHLSWAPSPLMSPAFLRKIFPTGAPGEIRNGLSYTSFNASAQVSRSRYKTVFYDTQKSPILTCKKVRC